MRRGPNKPAASDPKLEVRLRHATGKLESAPEALLSGTGHPSGRLVTSPFRSLRVAIGCQLSPSSFRMSAPRGMPIIRCRVGADRLWPSRMPNKIQAPSVLAIEAAVRRMLFLA
jgi:hypothetical protein